MLVVWAYDLDNIIPTCRDFEDKLIKLVWSSRLALVGSGSFVIGSSSAIGSPAVGSEVGLNLNEKSTPEGDAAAKEGEGEAEGNGLTEKEVAARVSQKVQSSKRKHGGAGGKSRGCRLGLGYFVSRQEDVEKEGSTGGEERPQRLLAPLYAGIAAGLSVCECLPSLTFGMMGLVCGGC